jgi:TPP-dependent pyruvate/acetoin dehydrogenase alpha subunit
VSILVAETFRMGGHATHDEREARETFSPDLFRYWGARDPIGLFEEWLMGEGVDRDALEAIERRVADEVDAAAEARSRAAPPPMPAPDWFSRTSTAEREKRRWSRRRARTAFRRAPAGSGRIRLPGVPLQVVEAGPADPHQYCATES